MVKMAESIQRGRMVKTPAPELAKHIMRPGMEEERAHSYQTLCDINKAHVLMLAKQNIIQHSVAKKILQVTQEIAAQEKNPEFDINPNLEDFYIVLERYLIAKTSLEIGGQQHTARSRNDLYATMHRLDLRKQYLELAPKFIALRKRFLELARTGYDIVLSGVTHLQPAEPITLAHYYSAILAVMQRDYKRFSAVWDCLNQCPLGGTSMGSTTFNIDRQYTSDLLGFDKPVENSLDCTTRDYALEFTAALAMSACSLSRFAMDHYLFSTPEYGYIELDDSVAGSSSIMPQKKNPITLEHIKGKSGHLASFFMSVFCAQKNVPFMHCHDISHESMRYVNSAVKEFDAQLDLFIATLRDIQYRPEKMLERARRNFCTVTELANWLVRIDGVSFRTAHETCGSLVGYMIERHLRSDQITLEDLNRNCQLHGFKTKMTAQQVQQALDPLLSVHSKTCRGGTAKAEVQRQLDLIDEQISKDESELLERQHRVQRAKAQLEHKTDEFIEHFPGE